MTEGTTYRAAILPVIQPAAEACASERVTGSNGARVCACGAAFTCDFSAGRDRCWCQDYPAVMPMNGAESACMCPTCLQREIAARLATG